MKPKTAEFLYTLLWTCDAFSRPTFRNMTDSFEGWAYRNGFHRQLAELERREFLESQGARKRSIAPVEWMVRLTEQGRLQALGGRDPEARWSRGWDGLWRIVLFDVSVGQDLLRDRLRKSLRERGFGCLQQSVWIRPDPIEQDALPQTAPKQDVRSLFQFEARTETEATNAQLVAAAWNFERLNEGYQQVITLHQTRPKALLNSIANASRFQDWFERERRAWHSAVAEDPLLPESLLPPGYLGRKAWQTRLQASPKVKQQIHSFDLA